MFQLDYRKMGHPTDGLLSKNIGGIIPRWDDPAEVLGLQTTPKTTTVIFLYNGQVNVTIASGPIIHNKSQSG